MGKITVFNFITLDGFYKDLNNGINWHKHGPEESEFSAENLQSENTILFGRVTYEMMKSFWNSQMAFEMFPLVATGMTACEKVVFSNTLTKADWNNTIIIGGDIFTQVKKLKYGSGKGMTILGRGTIINQFIDADLIDEIQIMIDPVAIGNGVSIFKDIHHQLNLNLVSTRTFKSGTVLLTYTCVR